MKNNIKRIWCQCCDDGDNENCAICASTGDSEISVVFNSSLNIIHGNYKNDPLLLSDIKFFLTKDSEEDTIFIGDCYNIEDEAFVNIEFDDGKIFEDDIANALRYLISTNTETESI